MNLQTVLTFSVVAGVSIVSPGPAVLLALRNSISFGVRSVFWSSLGNVTGIFFLSASAMLGLGVLLKSSALLFEIVKIIGALYLFYMGVRHLFGHASLPASNNSQDLMAPSPRRLYLEALITAGTNPKPILFFTALFPQFLDVRESLVPQFFILTGIFMVLSFLSLLSYALIAGRARVLLSRPRFSRWVSRLVGATFISFGAGLLVLRRQAA